MNVCTGTSACFSDSIRACCGGTIKFIVIDEEVGSGCYVALQPDHRAAVMEREIEETTVVRTVGAYCLSLFLSVHCSSPATSSSSNTSKQANGRTERQESQKPITFCSGDVLVFCSCPILNGSCCRNITSNSSSYSWFSLACT